MEPHLQNQSDEDIIVTSFEELDEDDTELLGGNEYTKIYKVKHTATNKYYALKEKIMIKGKVLMQENCFKYDILNTCPHAIRCYGAFEQQSGLSKSLYTILDLCEQGTLEELIKKTNQQNTFFDTQLLLKYVNQLCSAVSHFHTHGVAHRNIKPANIFLTDNQQSLKLGDFGRIKYINERDIQSTNYLAPEVWNTKEFNQKTDIWALGCVLYELCTLTDYHSVRTKKCNLNKDSKDLVKLPGHYSSGLKELIVGCLMNDPQTRNLSKEVLAQILSEKTYSISEIASGEKYEFAKIPFNTKTEFFEFYLKGKGKFAKVYTARHKITRKVYALKEIASDEQSNILLDVSKTDRKRLDNELKILCGLENPHILKGYSHFVEDNYDYLVLECCEGGDLLNFLKRRNKTILLEEDQIWRIFCQMCLGVNFLHKNNIVHRDLATRNILFMREEDCNSIKVGDFGLVKIISDPNASETISLNIAGVNLAPECTNKKHFNFKTDVWALGCILFEICTFHHPTYSPKVVWEGIKREDLIDKKYSENIAMIVDCCLEMEPEKRLTIPELLEHPFIKEKLSEFGFA